LTIQENKVDQKIFILKSENTDHTTRVVTSQFNCLTKQNKFLFKYYALIFRLPLTTGGLKLLKRRYAWCEEIYIETLINIQSKTNIYIYIYDMMHA